MLLLALFIGVVLIVAAVRNSQGALFTALMQDVPDFVVWAAAIIALGAVGYVPGLKPVSRGLLMLVITVIVLRNYKNIISGFQNSWTAPADTPTTVDTSVITGAAGTSVVTVPGFVAPANSNDFALTPDILKAYQQKYGTAPTQGAIDLFNHQNSVYEPGFGGTGSLTGSGIPGS
jgi:hypothetical protein